MNSSIIINDIRRRSIRLQRDQMLESIRREEEFYEAPLPQRIIIEAEERAKMKTDSQTWKKSTLMFVVLVACLYLVFRFMTQTVQQVQHAQVLQKEKRVTSTIAIQTDVDDSRGSRVSFAVDEKLERLKTEYPKIWRSFETRFRRDWLKSPISGPLVIDYFHLEERLAIDVLHYDMLGYPNNYHSTEEAFENFIYERKLKMDLCLAHDIDYQELVIEPDSIGLNN